MENVIGVCLVMCLVKCSVWCLEKVEVVGCSCDMWI